MQDRSSFFFSFSAKLCAFRNDRGGAIAYLTAFLSLALVGLTGLAIDFGLMVSQRSKLDVAAQAAVNSAANAARNMLQLNMTQNSSFDAPALAEGERVAQESFDGQLGQTTGLNVTTKYVVMSRVGNTISAQLDYEAIATPYFAQMFNVNEFTLKGKASIIIGLVDNPPSSKLIEEGWQDAGVAASTFAVTTPSYRDWAIQGPPVTIGPSGDARAGASGALLGGGGNNVLVKKVYMPAGAYELRYWYKSSVIYPEYQPVYICNAMGIDSVDWAISDKYREYNSSTVKSNSPRSAQLGVFLHPVKEDPRLALAPPPIANYVNRIDTCVYSARWVERSIALEVTQSGYFWLAFVSEVPATSDKKGGWIGKVKLCIASCGEPLPNNFPYGVNDLLFQDTFDSPVVTADTLMTGARPGFTQRAKHEVNPSTEWYFETPTGVFLSKDVPLVGQNALFKRDTYFGRRVLLSPGRYIFHYDMRGDNNSSLCPRVRPETQFFGGSLDCVYSNVPKSWLTGLSRCFNVYSSGFYFVGLQAFLYGRNSEMRLDVFRLNALFSGGSIKTMRRPIASTQCQ